MIERHTTPEIVIREIKKLVSNGAFKPGTQLPTANELAERFGVGRSSIREALRALSVLGYIEIFPGKGTFVKEDFLLNDAQGEGLLKVLRSEDIFEIMEAREWLECHCAEGATTRATSAQINRMKEIIAVMNDPNSNLEEINTADLGFHLILAEATNNKVVCEIMKLLLSKVETYGDKFWATLPKTKTKTISTLTETFNHIISGQGKEAAITIQEHLSIVKSKLKEVIIED